jgi:predicted nucleotidyltransferase
MDQNSIELTNRILEYKMISETTIRNVVGDIVRTCKPTRVILFGSYSRGKQTPDSDLDIFVVASMRGSSSERSRRVRRAISGTGFGIDVVVRTPAEFRRALKGRDWFVQEIDETGKVLYQR